MKNVYYASIFFEKKDIIKYFLKLWQGLNF